jgi:rubrerythrin
MSGGKIQVESKDDIKKRIGRSPDDGDAVVMAFNGDGGSYMDAYGVVRCPGCGRAYLAAPDGKPRDRCPHCGAAAEAA